MDVDNSGEYKKYQSRKIIDRPVKLVPIEKGDKTVGGRRSVRVRKFKWVLA